MGPLSVTLPICLIIFAAAFVQSTTGFGYGIVAIPLLTAFYLPPETALPLSATTAVTQSFYGVFRFRKEVNFREILPYSASCNAGLVAGVFLLKALTRFDKDIFGIVIGCLLLVIIFMRLFVKPEPRDTVPWYWGTAALFLGGLISGLAGIGGPLIVLWVMAHKWDSRRIRATLWTVFLFMTIFLIGMYAWVFGSPSIQGFLSGLVIIPVVLVASFLGIKMGNVLKDRIFTVAITVMVVLVAAYSIAKPFIR